MKTSTPTFKLTALAAGLLFAATAQAATWTEVGPGSPIDFYDGSTLLYSVTYSPSPAEVVKYYPDNITPQDAATMAGVINTVFGLSGSSAVAFVSGCEDAFGSCTNASAGASNTPYSFTSNVAYDYLAVHFGQAELLFHWAAPVAAGTEFTLTTTGRDLSNYRAFMAPVPEPGTYAMLLAGLGLMGVLARRRRH